jgi:hypothetical protein
MHVVRSTACMLSDAPQESKSPMRALLILQIPASVTRKDVGVPPLGPQPPRTLRPSVCLHRFVTWVFPNLRTLIQGNTTVWMETGADSEYAKDCERLHRALLTMLASLAPEEADAAAQLRKRALSCFLNKYLPVERQLLPALGQHHLHACASDRPVSVQRVQSITPSSARFTSQPIWTTGSDIILQELRLNQGKHQRKPARCFNKAT